MSHSNWPTTGSILFLGSIDIAKEQAKKILVEKSPRSNALWESGTHPDFYWMGLDAHANTIKVDAIRDLNEWSLTKPQISAKKVAIIYPAHLLNLQAANAFLKTLEEPIENLLFILVTENPSLLPATIRSRCFLIRARSKEKNSPDKDLIQTIKKDLEDFKNEKLDLITISERWTKGDIAELLNAWLFMLNEEMKKNKTSNRSLWLLFDKLLQAKKNLVEGAKPNTPLLLESLLVEFSLL